MSPKLRPLQLPLLVEQRRKRQEAQSEADRDYVHTFQALEPSLSSSSDTVSPVTPTFSPRGHLRYSSSTSSFELATPASSDGPSSPSQASHKVGNRFLPDVQEELVEPEDSDVESEPFDERELDGLYDCLCTEHCFHGDTDLARSDANLYSHARGGGYDIGFLSDSECNVTLTSSTKSRGGAESPISGITHRIGSKFTGLARWRPSRQASVTHSPVSDFGFDQQPSLSRAASSRSSSRSASGGYHPDRINEPPLPPTPALSFYDSSDSLATPAPIDIEKACNIDPASIERERALATTPLLPPLMNDTLVGPATAHASPLESPKVASLIAPEPRSPLVLSPPLSTRPSVSSFHRIAMSGELPHQPVDEVEEQWRNRLGHANFTIMPLPYKPEIADLGSLRQLRSDWDIARVNYTKHLVRTGEHYGITSKTYALTEAKWSETDCIWRRMHDGVAESVVASGAAAALAKFDEGVITTVPRMDTEGKFPERGDEDIIGPMVREATMLASGDGIDRKNTNFWRNLAGRVGLRK
ncbi:hypothetical protein BJ170DRAFT_65346 [Xylariales sp. AK1849]|nr:hypothetical protein BJ170DRAFT_65346 [Xylariales sp. AK1849]